MIMPSEVVSCTGTDIAKCIGQGITPGALHRTGLKVRKRGCHGLFIRGELDIREKIACLVIADYHLIAQSFNQWAGESGGYGCYPVDPVGGKTRGQDWERV